MPGRISKYFNVVRIVLGGGLIIGGYVQYKWRNNAAFAIDCG